MAASAGAASGVVEARSSPRPEARSSDPAADSAQPAAVTAAEIPALAAPGLPNLVETPRLVRSEPTHPLPQELRHTLAPTSPRRPAKPPRPPEVPQAWSDSRYSIALALLDFTMAADDNAIFVTHREEDQSTTHLAPYRATVFWPVRMQNGEERLYSFLRARFGGVSKECDSPLYFLRSQDEPFAGAAWELLGSPIAEVDLPTLSDAGNDKARWRQLWKALGIPDRVIETMGEHGHSYLPHVRSVHCVGTQTEYGPLVLCLESTRRDGFGVECLTSPAQRAYDNLGHLLKDHIQTRARGHSDFWTWLLGTFWPFLPVGSLLLSVGTWSADKVLATRSPSWLKYLGPDQPVVPLVALVALAWFVLPHGHPLWKGAWHQVRINRFQKHWSLVWWSLLVHQLLLGAALMITQPTVVWLSERLATGALAFAAFRLFASYSCFTKFAARGEPVAQQEAAAQVNPLVSVACFLVGVVGFADSPLRMFPAGVLLAVGFCLLIGRLDSRLIGTPPYLITVLYMNAVLYPLSCVLCMLKSMADSASAQASLARDNPVVQALVAQLSQAASLSRFLCVPLTITLFVVVRWVVQGRAMERYLLNVERVARVVPSRTFLTALAARRPPASSGGKPPVAS